MDRPPTPTTIPTYDLNWAWGRQYVEITLQVLAYQAATVVGVGGNCHGADVMESAIEKLADELLCDAESDDRPARITLRDASGNTLFVESDYEEHHEQWLKQMVVGVRIIGYQPPPQNTVRRANGAEPIEGGDAYPPPVGWVPPESSSPSPHPTSAQEISNG